MSRRPHFPGAYRHSVPCGMYPHEKAGKACSANRRIGRGISPPADSGRTLMRSHPGPDAAVAASPSRPVFCSVPAADAAGPLGNVPFCTGFTACAELLFRNPEQQPASGAVRTADCFGQDQPGRCPIQPRDLSLSFLFSSSLGRPAAPAFPIQLFSVPADRPALLFR